MPPPASEARVRSNIEWSHIGSSTVTLSDPTLGGGMPLRPVTVVTERGVDGSRDKVSIKRHDYEDDDDDSDANDDAVWMPPSNVVGNVVGSSASPVSSRPSVLIDMTRLFGLVPSRHPPSSLAATAAARKAEVLENLAASWESGLSRLFELGCARHSESSVAAALAARLNEGGRALHVVVEYPEAMIEGGREYDVGKLWARVRRRSQFNTVNRLVSLVRKAGLGLILKAELCGLVHGLAHEEKAHLKFAERRTELSKWREEGRPEKVRGGEE